MACFSLSTFETNDEFEGSVCCTFARRKGVWWGRVVTGWVGPRVGLYALEEKKFSQHFRGLRYDCLVIQFVA
jgi:hypothetical protein